MSLRDELLKAGLVSADKAKKLESDTRNQEHQRKKSKALSAEEAARQAEARQRAEAEAARKREQDRQLNQKREAEKQRREQAARAHQLIDSHRLNDPKAEIFYNFIDNSLKYGQKITKMRIHYEQTSQGELRLIYEDDGVGIPETEKPKLFKQGYSTGGSTGYGLYLIRKMIEVYGWTIQETGTPGKGAQFTITIPETNQTREENYRFRAREKAEA